MCCIYPIAFLALMTPAGCERPSTESRSSRTGAVSASTSFGPESSAIQPVLDQGWCGGHGVPESVCTRCNDTLVVKFQEAEDWCGEHGLPESQCGQCHPEVAAKWAALNPDATPARGESDERRGPAGEGDQNPTDPDTWCFEHGVPKAVCTRCDPTLIPNFKEAHDWCNEHGVPESQCVQCNPDCRAKWDAMRPGAPQGDGTRRGSTIQIEHDGRRHALGDNDPLCQIESERIRFRDPSIVRQAGIEVAAVRPRRMTASINVPAEIRFDATRVTRITPRVPGVAREVRAGLGDAVQSGDVLAVFDSTALGEAKSRYIERKQDLSLAEAEHQRVLTVYEGTQQLLSVATASATAAEIQGRLEGIAVGESRAKLLRAHAELQLMRANAARQARLAESKANAKKDVEAAEAALAAAEADFLANREEIAFSNERERRLAERALRVALAALDAADRELRLLGLTDEQVAEIGREEHEALARCELRSPVAGRVIECNVAAGEAVELGETLFVVVDASRLWVVAGVYERDLPALREGLPLLFIADGLPGGGFEGRLSWISSQVDDTTRRVPVRGELANPEGLLRAHMFGQARIVLREIEDVLSVPLDAVQTDGCCQLAFVRESDDVFAPRKVRLGASAGGYVEVVKGLREGELIATAGTFLMKTEILKGNIGAGCCEVDPGR